MIWCRCNAHLVESDDDQTPDVECCVCRGKILQAARRRRNGQSQELVPRHPHGDSRFERPATFPPGVPVETMAHPHRNVKPENMPHGGRR